ncbi:uncharacterized protein LOC130048657 [Ostrea edulis]|uniref:uncharacterized protein LOC130048657 n=1 Tax=Ostrea edulis TaxID=37623 RepID=UPI0024AF1833|nr:uncharacterized protein LOC130048657 [Ostrea edulis]
MVQNCTDLEPISKVLDGNMDTFYHSKENDQASWFLKLDKNYVMKWILLSIRGGYYELHIKDGDVRTSSSTLCRNFSFTGPNELKQNNKALECNREMTGNSVVIIRTDGGPLRLFEVYPIICPEKHYGPNCAKCRMECISCSPITGVCYRCNDGFYGDFCQHTCLEKCLNSMCDQMTGECKGWKTELTTHSTIYVKDAPVTKEMGIIQDWKRESVTHSTFSDDETPITKKMDVTHEMFSERTPQHCDRSCIACIPAVQVCLLCTMHQLLYRCRYECNALCSGETCHDLEENCTRNIVENDFLDCSKICTRLTNCFL